MIQTYHLTPQDTLAGMQAKLHASPTERVLFVVPAELALDAVALRVLRREAVSARVGLAFVTAEPALRVLADRAGISSFRTQERAERARWRRLRADRPVRITAPGPVTAIAPLGLGLFDAVTQAGRARHSGFRPFAFARAFVRKQSPWWATLGLVGCLLALSGGLLYALSTIIPAATIRLAPAAEPIQITAEMRAEQDARTDITAAIVPAQPLSVQVSGEARTETTGRRAEPATKAAGRVVLINRTSREITVPAGTVVSTATGNNIQFATLADLILPPTGRAPAPVEALLPGPSGNVRAGTITRVEGALGLSVLVANENNFAGGSTAQMGVVTEDDKIRLQDQLFEELKKLALERLNGRTAGAKFVPPESVSFLVLSPTFTPFVGEVSPDLYLSMSVQAVGLAVDKADADQVALARLQTAMPPGTRLISDTVQFTPGSVQLVDQSTVSLAMTAEGTLLRGIDAAAVREAVLGRTREDAEEILLARFALARPPEITLGPDWLPVIVPSKLPVLPWRIRVVVDWDQAVQLAQRP